MGLIFSPGSDIGGVNSAMNYPGSNYAANYSHAEDERMARIVRAELFDAAPRQFFDLNILGLQSPETKPSDEFEYAQFGWQRHPVVLTAAASGGASDVLAVVDARKVSRDMILKYPDNTSAIVTDVNTTTNSVTVKPLDGEPNLPALLITDTLALEAPVEGDRAQDFSAYTKIETTRNYNYIQLLSYAINYGRLELHKLKNANVYRNYLSADMKNMFDQYRISTSNMLWTGKRGQVTVGGQQRKTTGGIYNSMLEAGSPQAICDIDTLRDAFEATVDNTEFGDYGEVRFAFAESTLIRELSNSYKEDKTRYTPDNKVADLMLDMVKLGGSNVVFVPYNRFRDRGSFPLMYQNSIFLLDMKNIKPVQIWGETSGTVQNEERGKGGRKTETTSYVEGSFGLQFDNPLSCGVVQVNR